MLQVLLIDVDGVLANGEPFSKQLAREYGITREMTSTFFGDRFLDCLVGKADLRHELVEYLEQWEWTGSVDDFLQIWFLAEHRIDEPLVEAIQEWRKRGIRAYLATNQEKYRTAYILEQMGFAEKFEGVFASANVGYMKNNPTFFVEVLQKLGGIEAQDILFWDDSAGNVAVAQSVGMQAKIYQGFADFQRKMERYR